MKRIMGEILFWVIACTWGFLNTFVGLMTALVLIIAGYKPKKFGPCISIQLKQSGGWGLELGPVFLYTCDADSFSLKCHECGHGLQLLMWGPLTPFVISIPSIIRFNMRNFKAYKDKNIFSAVIVGITVVIGIIGLVFGLLYKITVLSVIMTVLISYAVCIAVWLFHYEIPQYQGGQYVPYDKAWFEGDASTRGTKFISKYYSDIK